MSDFIPGQRIIDEYEILPFELLERFIHLGLFPHDPHSGRQIGVSQFLGALFNLQKMADNGHPLLELCKNFINANDATNWANFQFSGDVTIDQEIANALLDHVYQRKPYEELMIRDMENRHGPKPEPVLVKKEHTPYRSSQKHKEICQRRAERIWNIYPDMHPAELVTYQSFQHDIQKHNGDKYREDTLREWISKSWHKKYLGPPQALNIPSNVIDNLLKN